MTDACSFTLRRSLWKFFQFYLKSTQRTVLWLFCNFLSFFSVLSAILFISHFFTHAVAELLDPADPELRALDSKKPVPEFDRNKHAHVIENGRCHLCNITISSQRTKHCSACNKVKRVVKFLNLRVIQNFKYSLRKKKCWKMQEFLKLDHY